MVSVFSTLTVAAIALTASVNGLEVGEYFRPTGAQVSGYVDATTPYVRSPCPALNALANHGYLPRDGQAITRAQYKQAIESVYNIDSAVATTLVNNIPEVVSLAGLSKHNLVEHDASLAHPDSYYTAQDPSSLDMVLWTDLAGRAKNGKFGVSELAGARKDRMTRCRAKPTGCDFGLKQRTLAFGEAALLLRALGGKNEESITLEYATSFFVDEKIPATYTKPSSPVTTGGLLATSGKIQFLAPF